MILRGKKKFRTALVTALLLQSGLHGPAWADQFSDALISAYQTNPRLKAEREALAATDEEVPQAYSGFLPTAVADYSRGRQRTEVIQQTQTQPSTGWSYSDAETKRLTVTQPLFRGGRTIANVGRAKHLVKAGRADLRGEEQQVLADAVSAYMNVVRDQAVLELSRNNEEVLRKQLQASQDRFSVGEVTRTDVAQSEARLSRSETDTIQARGSLIASRANFERVIGHAPENLKAPEIYPDIPATLEEALDIGLKVNPSVVGAQHRQVSAEKDADINIGRLLPEVSLQGSVSKQKGLGFAGNADFDEDQIVVNARIPLYQSGAEYSEVRAAKARASQRKFELLRAQDEARESITQAWEDLQTSISTIKSTQDAIRAAEIALDGVKQEQLYGARTVLDVLDAEQELFVTRVNLVRAERNRAVSVYNLMAVIGKLNVSELGLETKPYDPKEHYDDVKYQFVGF